MEKPKATGSIQPLGDLIAAAGEMAFEYSENDKDAYNLAQLALVELIKNQLSESTLIKNSKILVSASQLIH